MRKWIVLLLLLVLLLTAATAFGQTETVTPSPTDTPTDTFTPTDTLTPTPTATSTEAVTAEASATSTSEVTPESSASVTPTLTGSPTITPSLTATFVVVPTAIPTQSAPAKFDTAPRIAIISAFAPELSALLAQTTSEHTYLVNGVQFTTGRLAGHEVVLWLSGVSMVNAAMNTQLGIDHFNVTRILFSGIAGGVNPNYHIGDVVIPAQWAQYEESYAARDLADGSVATPPATAIFAPFQFFYPQTVNVRSASNPGGEDMFWFAVDPQMLSVAVSVAPTVQLASCTASNVCLTDAPQIHVGGNGVSGPTFVDNANYRQYVYSTFDADALDEETASAAMVAYENSLPFLAFRSLSDLAGGGPGANEIGTFFQLAANNSAAVTIAFLHAWPGQ